MCLLVNWSGLWFGVVRPEHSPQCHCGLNCEYCDVYSFMSFAVLTSHNALCCVFSLHQLLLSVSFTAWEQSIRWISWSMYMCPSTPHCHSTWQRRWTEHCTVYIWCLHMSLTPKVIDLKIAFNCSVLEYSHSSEDVLTLYLVCMVTMDQTTCNTVLKCAHS